MEQIKEVHILNHTHWDREWYESFEQFRYKLRNGLRYVQELISAGEIENFFLDGQTIVLDDYREVVSEKEYERFLSLIKDQKIEVGPWYLLADEFLVSGEAMLKNLEIGIKTSKALGSAASIGYLPDTFGHISQMPQILKGYDIQHALIFRGAVSDSYENTWVGADNSKVFTFVLPLFEGYYQTFLKHKDFMEKTETYLSDKAPYLRHNKALIMNGADHTFVSRDLKDRIMEMQRQYPHIRFTQSLMSQYLDAFKEKDTGNVIKGEQRDPSKIFILPGVYSTRSYLKVQNQMCEDQAIGMMEALNVWNNGESDSAEFMDYVWKLILQNQPHDSICGCSVDEVHDEMETRTQKVLSAIGQFTHDHLNDEYPFEFIDSTVENPYLYLVNNTPVSEMYTVNASIRIPVPMDLGSIRLSHDDKDIPFDVIRREQREEFLHHILAEPHYAEYVIYDVTFNLHFDGVEVKRVRIEREAKKTYALEMKEADHIENEFYQIRWGSQGLSIKDIETGVNYKNQHHFLSSLDAGDSYNYSPPVNDHLSTGRLMQVSKIKKGKTFESAILHYELEQPASLNEDRTGPAHETVTSHIETTVTLNRGKRLIQFKTKVVNTAKDQKLRVGFGTGTDVHVSYGDTAFDLLERETLRIKEYDMPKNKEAVMNQYPTYSTVIAGDHQLVHRGLQEFEVERHEQSDMVFLTMIRSVGWLSRRDLRTRGNGAGPGFETPGAQCIGTYEFEYGLILGQNNMSLNHAKVMRQPVLTQQSYIFKKERNLFKQSSQVIVFSSFRQKDENSFDIRMFNPSSEEAVTTLHFGFDPEEVTKVNFNGESIIHYPAKREVSVSFQPKEIVTLRVKRTFDY
ncbi:glycosyl hydrolase-related protein [Jeotgalibacillus haloalkalitolerans]|uniref:Glycoside hydrolase family 38 C-terminal domain-containing protein n=1 Tax=Jeotgalibacillus haloalkalitolerans TaxID=3104292 RepID=A0ABU5KHT2_9BACL|nr:glycoside hydrolase family 38 C-terminal domain-containing protein [Jeotgalibacillus sp. HH7-29]MDZ5710683.1 glycoside hydrolase family 38 C-terminal domain-containing protein [Jeotgalibacillus sp. HH7-29]